MNKENMLEEKEMESDGLNERRETKFLKQTEIYEMFPFGKTKMKRLLESGELPVMKIGKDYLTTEELLVDWVKQNIGKEIYF